MATGVVLLAAGAGRRFGRAKPKQLHFLSGEPLFLKSFRVFSKHPSIKEIVLVVPRGKEPFFRKWIGKIPNRKRIVIVNGGKIRGESVRNGVRAISRNVRIVLIHDTARPLVSSDLIRRVEKAAAKHGVAVAAIPLTDTLKQSSPAGFVRKTIPRKRLYLAQTPQGFQRKIAFSCLLRPFKSVTDDVGLAENRGHRVRIVLGDNKNFKVTYPFELKVCDVLSRCKD